MQIGLKLKLRSFELQVEPRIPSVFEREKREGSPHELEVKNMLALSKAQMFFKTGYLDASTIELRYTLK